MWTVIKLLVAHGWMAGSLGENCSWSIVSIEVGVGLPGQISFIDCLSICNSLFDRDLFVVSKSFMSGSLRKFCSYIHIIRSINFRWFGLCKHKRCSQVGLLALLVRKGLGLVTDPTLEHPVFVELDSDHGFITHAVKGFIRATFQSIILTFFDVFL